MNISALLNPDHDRRQSNLSLRRRGASPTRRASTSPIDEGDSVTPTPKSMSREAKDAPKFEKGRPSGEVRYPPYHPVSDSIVQEMKRYSIFPETSIINSFPRHIPYNSDKKRFTARTGREGFEVFQYTFRYKEKPDEDDDSPDHSGAKDWVVMWDYNVGLVRITPFFKCQEYQKTVPAKVIGQNQGLSDLCHSITGGALAAQGYWMPYDAAKWIAVTFCWKIRYALVPLFGSEFPHLCIPPADPAYKRFTIDPEIIRCCASQLQNAGDGEAGQQSGPQLGIPAGSSTPPVKGPASSKRRSTRSQKYRARKTPVPEDSQPRTPLASNLSLNNESDANVYEPLTPASLRGTPLPRRSETPIDRQWAAASSRSSKRRRQDVETESDNATPSPQQMRKTRKRGAGKFSVEEMKAAQQLLELRYAR